MHQVAALLWVVMTASVCAGHLIPPEWRRAAQYGRVPPEKYLPTSGLKCVQACKDLPKSRCCYLTNVVISKGAILSSHAEGTGLDIIGAFEQYPEYPEGVRRTSASVTRVLPFSVVLQRYPSTHPSHGLVEDAFSVFQAIRRLVEEGVVSFGPDGPEEIPPPVQVITLMNSEWGASERGGEALAKVTGMPLLSLNGQTPQEVWFARELVVCTVRLGASALDTTYGIPGTGNGAWWAFRRILYVRYGVADSPWAPPSTSPPTHCNVVFLGTGAWPPIEDQARVMDDIREVSGRSGCVFRNVSLTEYPDVSDQLRLMRGTDVMVSVSSDDTVLNTLMMRPGSVHVSLGKRNGMCAVTNDFVYPALHWTTTLYLWPDCRCPRHLCTSLMLTKAINTWRYGYPGPFPPSMNQSPTHSAILDGLKLSPDSLRTLRHSPCLAWGREHDKTACDNAEFLIAKLIAASVHAYDQSVAQFSHPQLLSP